MRTKVHREKTKNYLLHAQEPFLNSTTMFARQPRENNENFNSQ